MNGGHQGQGHRIGVSGEDEVDTIRLKIPAVSFKYLSSVFLELGYRYCYRYRCNSAFMFLSSFYHCWHVELTATVNGEIVL